MFTYTLPESPRNIRGGQISYLLLTKGQFGSHRLSVTWVEAEPGSEQPSHVHSDNEQVYVIMRGRGLMTVGDEQREVAAETLVFIPPGLPHAIRNISSDQLVYVSATSPPFDLPPVSSALAYGDSEASHAGLHEH
jgi:mannose-6-phosphate isomerase-like protein (cupin superfamily)